MHLPRLIRQSSSVALILSGLAACQKAPENASPPSKPAVSPLPAAATVSAEPTSFDAVARHLDAGGGLYAYLSTEGFFAAASKVVREAEKAMSAEGTLPPEKKAQIEAVWKSFKPFLANSGLQEISGFGISSLALRPGYYRTKSMLHHYEDKGNGFLWKMTGTQARALDIIGYLPEKTALAGSFDLTFEPVWEELNRAAAGQPELQAQLDGLQAQLRAKSGLELSKLLAGLGPNYSYVVTLDESKPFALPATGGGEPVTIPEPGVALLIQIRDETLTQRIETELAKLPMASAADQGDLKVRKINLPTPFPFLTPAVAWKNGLLILSSSEALLHELLAVKEGKKPGLAATEKFKQVMADLPSPACSFGFVDPRFNKAVLDVQMHSLKQDANASNPAVQQFMKSLWSFQATEPQAGVGQSTPEGWISVTNGGPGPAQVAAVGAAVPAAILASVAMPAIAKARLGGRRGHTESEASRTLNDLRMLDAALDQWALEKNKKPGDQPTTDDIKPYLKAGTPLFKALESSPGANAVVILPGLPAVALPPVDDSLVVPAAIVEKFRATTPPEFWGDYAGN